MKKLIAMALSVCMVTPALAGDGIDWINVKSSNKSKLSSYMLGKSCLEVGKTFEKNGWTKYRNEPPAILSRGDKNHRLYKLFSKHSELQDCSGTGFGECYGAFKKGKYIVTVEYLAEGGRLFETEDCGVRRYNVSTNGYSEY